MLALLLRKLNSPLLRLATSGSLHSTSSGFSWSMDMFGYNKWYESLSQLTCDRMANTLPPSCANGLPYASAFSPLPSSFVPAPKRKAPRVLDQVGRRHLGLDLTASTHNTYIYCCCEIFEAARPFCCSGKCVSIQQFSAGTHCAGSPYNLPLCTKYL